MGGAMKPYYDHGGITIYHGDCRDILPSLGRVQLILTDPPWPRTENSRSEKNLWPGIDPEGLWREAASHFDTDRVLLWLPCHADPRRWLSAVSLPFLRVICIRRAIPGYYGRVLQDLEPVYALGSWPKARKGRLVIPGGITITYNTGDSVPDHPSPRSLEATTWLMHWWSEDGDTVVDPFMGSGTAARAAKDLGRRFIGIEIEERYCEIAVRRLAQEVLFT